MSSKEIVTQTGKGDKVIVFAQKKIPKVLLSPTKLKAAKKLLRPVDQMDLDDQKTDFPGELEFIRDGEWQLVRSLVKSARVKRKRKSMPKRKRDSKGRFISSRSMSRRRRKRPRLNAATRDADWKYRVKQSQAASDARKAIAAKFGLDKPVEVWTPADYQRFQLFKRGGPGSKQVYGDTWASASEAQKANRVATGFRGRGDYKSIAKWIPRGLGALIGGAGASWAEPMNFGGILSGAEAGWKAGENISKFLGWGDYTSTNQIVNSGQPMAAFGGNISVNSGDMSRDIFIENTEFVGNVFITGPAGGSSAFELRSYGLNPTDDTTFPFLAQIAKNYIMYEWQGLMFQYRPTAGDDANSIALGKMIAVTEYDPDARPFENSYEMANYSYAQTCKPTCGAVHGIETAPEHLHGGNSLLYCRVKGSSKDRSETDIGTFYLGSEGIPMPGSGGATTNVLVGELWVAYRCRLTRPNLSHSILGEDIDFDFIRTSHTNALSVSAATYKANNMIGATVSSAANNTRTLTFPRKYGTFLITQYIDTATASFQFITPTASAGVSVFNLASTSAGISQAPDAALATNNGNMSQFIIHIPPTIISTPSVTMTHTALTDSAATDYILIQECAYSLTKAPHV